MKYARTPHLKWSIGGTADDIRLANTSHFNNKTLLYSEKLDGECSCLTRDTIHARSEDGYCKSWQTYMKSYWNNMKHNIPDDMTIFGENLYAIHSIEYNSLPSYFFVFNIVYKGVFISYQEMSEWCELLDLHKVPVFLKSDRLVEMEIPSKSAFGDVCEGYVVRNIEAFPIEEFQYNVAKCVRENHVKTDEHWTKNWKKAKLI